jgi:hypothetical protein
MAPAQILNLSTGIYNVLESCIVYISCMYCFVYFYSFYFFLLTL